MCIFEDITTIYYVKVKTRLKKSYFAGNRILEIYKHRSIFPILNKFYKKLFYNNYFERNKQKSNYCNNNIKMCKITENRRPLH